MNKIKLGVLREGKVPPDFRVPLTPELCVEVQKRFPNVEVVVQKSPIRCFNDEAYSDLNIRVQEDISECDVLIGVKEVKVKDLIPNKKFMFFSHTIKKQPYNRELLRTILDYKIQLIDYEVLKNKEGKRLIGFGRYAGIVGCYNGFRAYGLKHNLYELKPANQCVDRKEMEAELSKVLFLPNTKIVLTGFGRVGNGAREIINILPIKEVTPESYLTDSFTEPVFTHLEINHYYARQSDGGFDKKEFYTEPHLYASVFEKFATVSDMYVACHFWSNKSPFILDNEAILNSPKLKVVADVSCDVQGPIACTIKASTIADPFFGYNPYTQQETNYTNEEAVIVIWSILVVPTPTS